jgi:iron(III) transport system permease protein
MNWTLLQNSLLVSASATVLATLFGVLAALAFSALERRWRNIALALAITALALPPFLVTNCWLHYLGAAGTWRDWLPCNLFSLGGATWLLALQLWPVSALAAWAAWQAVEPPLLEADPAARGWTMIRWLLLPLAGKALGFSSLLTFVLALNNFAVPAILQVKVLPAEVWVQFSTNLDPLAALRVGWPLVLAPLLVLPWLARQDLPWPRQSGPASARIFRRQLGGGWRALSLTVTALLLAFSVALPAVQLAGSARTWTELPAAVEAGQSAAWHSFAFAAISATLVVVFGLALAIVLQGRSSFWRQPCLISGADGDFGFRNFLSWLPFFVPGVLLGIALIALFNRPATFWLYRGAGIVVVALVVRYLALGWNGAALALRQTDPDLTDAGRLGCRRRCGPVGAHH